MKLKLKRHFTIQSILLATLLMVPASAYAADSAVVEKIIDGETIQLASGEEIRLIGVSTQSQDGPKNATFGRAAYLSKKFMQAAVQGKHVILSYDPIYKRRKNRDSEGRTLAYVRYSAYFQNKTTHGAAGAKYQSNSLKRLLNSELIKNGYAFANRKSNYADRKNYERFEADAKEKQKGIWKVHTNFYDKMLERAKGSRSGATSKYIDKATRRLSLDTARKTLTELIELKPKDYRAYYERSWLGLDPLNNQVEEENLEDITKATELSPNNPKCFVQRHFILRLMGRHGEAVLAYEKAVDLASKYGMNASVTYFSEQEMETGRLGDPPGDKETLGFTADAFRASLNEDHFLVFMARYKHLRGDHKVELKAVLDKMLEKPVFKAYYDKHKIFIDRTNPQGILYKTNWALNGWDEPEEALTQMEKADV